MARFQFKPQIVFWALAVGLLMVSELLFFRSYLSVTVIANGEELVLRRWSSLRTALAEGGLEVVKGDVVTRQGRLIRKGAGGSPLVLLNGRRVGLDAVVKPLDRISVYRGKDIKETISRRLELVQPATFVRGGGAFVFVAEHGSPGIEEVSAGDKTGIVVDSRKLRDPNPAVVRRFDKKVPMVALTFDDGPSPRTRGVLDILDNRQVPATFFVVGKHIKKFPEILKEVSDRGHPIGNHTYSHSFLDEVGHKSITAELGRNETLIGRITGQRTRWFRPPGGMLSSLLLKTAETEGYNLIMWSVDPADWNRKDRSDLAARVLAETAPGSVILLHDGGGGGQRTVDALPEIIDGLRARGYEFVTLEELNAAPGGPS
ncbi:MAG: polysaccharide deacetylase family protein [Terriglobia bacterium]